MQPFVSLEQAIRWALDNALGAVTVMVGAARVEFEYDPDYGLILS